jgi:hypothetical protein
MPDEGVHEYACARRLAGLYILPALCQGNIGQFLLRDQVLLWISSLPEPTTALADLAARVNVVAAADLRTLWAAALAQSEDPSPSLPPLPVFNIPVEDNAEVPDSVAAAVQAALCARVLRLSELIIEEPALEDLQLADADILETEFVQRLRERGCTVVAATPLGAGELDGPAAACSAWLLLRSDIEEVLNVYTEFLAQE